MTVYETGAPWDYREIDRWEGGAGWLAHPDETIARAIVGQSATAARQLLAASRN